MDAWTQTVTLTLPVVTDRQGGDAPVIAAMKVMALIVRNLMQLYLALEKYVIVEKDGNSDHII